MPTVLWRRMTLYLGAAARAEDRIAGDHPQLPTPRLLSVILHQLFARVGQRIVSIIRLVILNFGLNPDLRNPTISQNDTKSCRIRKVWCA